MKNQLKALASPSLLAFRLACGTQQPADARNPPRSTAGLVPANLNGLALATFAGGCFWAQEEAFEQLRGVKQGVSGYAGGPKSKPTCEQVAGKTTGHTETVQIYYAPPNYQLPEAGGHLLQRLARPYAAQRPGQRHRPRVPLGGFLPHAPGKAAARSHRGPRQRVAGLRQQSRDRH